MGGGGCDQYAAAIERARKGYKMIVCEKDITKGEQRDLRKNVLLERVQIILGRQKACSVG